MCKQTTKLGTQCVINILVLTVLLFCNHSTHSCLAHKPYSISMSHADDVAKNLMCQNVDVVSDFTIICLATLSIIAICCHTTFSVLVL